MAMGVGPNRPGGRADASNTDGGSSGTDRSVASLPRPPTNGDVNPGAPPAVGGDTGMSMEDAADLSGPPNPNPNPKMPVASSSVVSVEATPNQ